MNAAVDDTGSSGGMTLRAVVIVRISAAIRSPRSQGDDPTRRNGLSTGAATCQVTDICVVGSAPNAMCAPYGGTADPPGRLAWTSSAGADRPGVTRRPVTRLAVARLAVARLAVTRLAVTRLAVTRLAGAGRPRAARANHSYCSARLRRLACSGVIRYGLTITTLGNAHDRHRSAE